MIQLLLELWRPVLEISIIWAVLYWLLRFFRGTRAIQVLAGLLVLAIFFIFSKILQLHTIDWVFTKLLAIGVIAFLIIFQPELRRALARVGQTTAFNTFFEKGGLIDEVVRACDTMSRQKRGMLIAIERDVGLKNYIESGVTIDSTVSAELLLTVFHPNTALHDGAVVIQGNRVAAAACLFPLTQGVEVSKTLGTRHRAALGLTEETDAVCLVVSEESGMVSVAVHGKLTRDLDTEHLRRVLKSLFRPEQKNFLTNLGRSFGIDRLANR